jgi:hypothetical protein
MRTAGGLFMADEMDRNRQQGGQTGQQGSHSGQEKNQGGQQQGGQADQKKKGGQNENVQDNETLDRQRRAS